MEPHTLRNREFATATVRSVPTGKRRTMNQTSCWRLVDGRLCLSDILAVGMRHVTAAVS